MIRNGPIDIIIKKVSKNGYDITVCEKANMINEFGFDIETNNMEYNVNTVLAIKAIRTPPIKLMYQLGTLFSLAYCLVFFIFCIPCFMY